MANATAVVIGNLTADPELRYTQDGVAVASFTIAATDRVADRNNPGQYVDGAPFFMRCTVWREYAEHVAGSLTKGLRVIATGALKMDSYETKEGERRTSVELTVTEIGPVLRFATASVLRAVKGQPAAPASAPQSSGRRAAPVPEGQPF